MTPLESFIAEVKAAEAKATKGPWISGVNGNMRVYGPDSSGELSGLLAVLIGSGERIADTRDFITNSRTYVHKLVRVVEAGAALRDMLEDVAYSKSQYATRAIEAITTYDVAIAAALAGSEGEGPVPEEKP